MKTRTLIVTLVVLTTTVFCCTEEECRDESIIDTIIFKNFNSTEIDTLLFMSFNKNSNFTAEIDSFFVCDTITLFKGGTKGISLPYLLDIQYDWKIKLISTQAIYRITDFIILKEECSYSSGGCSKSPTYYNNLDSYKINGILQKDDIVTIRK